MNLWINKVWTKLEFRNVRKAPRSCDCMTTLSFKSRFSLGLLLVSKSKLRGMKIEQCIDKRLLENREHQRLSIFKFYSNKRKFLKTVSKTTVWHIVRLRRKSSIIIHPSLALGKPRPSPSRSLRNLSRVTECRHSASLGRFVPHHASAVWPKAPLHRTIFRLNLEKKMAAPMINMLTSSAINGCDLL